MFCGCEVLQHFLRRPEENEAAPFVQQHRFVEHLEDFRSRRVNGDENNFVVRKTLDDLDYVLGIFGGEPGRWFIEEINIRRAEHIQTDVQPLAFAAAQIFFD